MVVFVEMSGEWKGCNEHRGYSARQMLRDALNVMFLLMMRSLTRLALYVSTTITDSQRLRIPNSTEFDGENSRECNIPSLQRVPWTKNTTWMFQKSGVDSFRMFEQSTNSLADSDAE